MDNQRISEALLEEQRTLTIQRLKVTFYYMATPIVVAFSLVDWFYCPEYWLDFLKLRLLVIPVSIICTSAFSIPIVSGRYFNLPGYLFSLYLGWLNSYMALKTGAEISPYYAGLNLVAIGSLSFLPWRPRELPWATSTIYFPYFLLLAVEKQSYNWTYFTPHLAFIGSTIFLGIITSLLFYQLRRSDIISRLQLKDELATKQEVIRQKTQEGVYLQKLAMQFSPQVIEAIKNGEISLTDLKRRDVTCIFIDIENSTRRSSQIDHYTYAEVIQHFFSFCIDVLLRHNVTVGTYLGDGLLAFVNAPQTIKNHKLVAVSACLDLLKLHAQKMSYYREKWGTELNVRIGVNAGFSQIGFFPNERRGTYTTIGKSVNLAARLCTKAKENSICITKAFLRDVGSDLKNVNVSLRERCSNIKGFEGERFELFSVEAVFDAVSITGDKCPLCGSGFTPHAELGDTLLLKCINCGYMDTQENTDDTLKKAA